MFRTIWSKTLRDYRYAIIGWGVGLGLGLLLTMVYYGSTGESARVAEAQYASSFRFMGDPVAVGTTAGYVTWHTVGILPVALSIWTVLAGAWLARGEEERRSLDLALATAHSRARVLLEKIAAFVTALAGITLLLAASAIGGELGSDVPVDVWGALLLSVNVALTALVFGMLALLFSQVFARRAVAAGWAGALVVIAYLLNGTGRMIDHGEWLQRLTPFYYHDLSKPLIPGYGVNVGALLLLAGLCVALGAASVALFVRRDIGGVAMALPGLRRHGRVSQRAQLARARRDIWVRSVGLRALRAELSISAWWIIIAVGVTVWLMLLARTTKDAVYAILAGAPEMARILSAFDVRDDTGFIAAMLFLYLPVMLALFAMMLAMAWPRDLESGRAELGLSTPIPRWRMYVERFGAALAPMVLAPLVVGLTVVITARLAGLTLDVARVPAALLGLLALELITAATVYVLAGWLRYAALVGLIGTLIGVSYLAEVLNPLIKLPEWVITLSIFHHFGAPLTQPPYWIDWLVMTLLAVVLLTLGALRFGHSDVRGAA